LVLVILLLAKPSAVIPAKAGIYSQAISHVALASGFRLPPEWRRI